MTCAAPANPDTVPDVDVQPKPSRLPCTVCGAIPAVHTLRGPRCRLHRPADDGNSS